MATLTLLEMAEKVLAASKIPLTIVEIWEQATAAKLVKQLRGSKGKTPMDTMGAKLYVNVRDNPESRFAKVGARPARFTLSSKVASLASTFKPDEAAKTQPSKYVERDLHPLLVHVAYGVLFRGAHCKTIFHEKAKKGGFSQWLYPDLVGLELTAQDRHKDVVELGRQLGQAMAKVYSFEVKMGLSFQNLREAFFQAVSNSSWAHEGYLAAVDIDEDPDFRNELRRLSDSFGIGVIRLDAANPDDSEVLFAARERSDLDWETVNKIAEQSPDFLVFLQAARNAVVVNKVDAGEFDLVHEAEKLSALLTGKTKAHPK